jgi:hypothetical protein
MTEADCVPPQGSKSPASRRHAVREIRAASHVSFDDGPTGLRGYGVRLAGSGAEARDAKAHEREHTTPAP